MTMLAGLGERLKTVFTGTRLPAMLLVIAGFQETSYFRIIRRIARGPLSPWAVMIAPSPSSVWRRSGNKSYRAGPRRRFDGAG